MVMTVWGCVILLTLLVLEKVLYISILQINKIYLIN